MDIVISRWILEFILRQPLDDSILNALIHTLTLPNDNLNLKKALILRKLESEISNSSVTEKILELLELFEELDHQEGTETLKEMKSAYCAVAVECTVKFLNEKGAESDKGKYFEAVKRIWKKRINLMEKIENVGFVCEELWDWRDEIEAALWEDKCCDNVIRRSRGIFPVEAVKVFVREAKERIGPPFLDVVAETYRSDDAVREIFGGVNEQGTCRNSVREVRKGNALPRQKHVAFRRTRGASAETRGGVKISDSIELGLDASGGQDSFLPMPEIEKAQEALKLSSKELRDMVKDPLPDALQFAETLSSLLRDHMGHQPAQKNSDRAPHPVVASSKLDQTNGENCEAQCNCHPSAASKPDLMNRKSAAHTSERDDSADELNEESPSGTRRFTLPSPKRTKNSPLKKYEFKNFTTRRKPTKWSALEEDTLRTGVQKYGSGNWTHILNTYRDIFVVRTAGDLKDKWRNMMS